MLVADPVQPWWDLSTEMFYREIFWILSGVGLLANTASAGFQFQIASFNAGGTAQNAFNVGDTVRIRLLGIDTAGANPNFAVNNLSAFNAVITASSTDANGNSIGLGSEASSVASRTTFNPSFAADWAIARA